MKFDLGNEDVEYLFPFQKLHTEDVHIDQFSMTVTSSNLKPGEPKWILDRSM
jgi:hypothetical protein